MVKNLTSFCILLVWNFDQKFFLAFHVTKKRMNKSYTYPHDFFLQIKNLQSLPGNFKEKIVKVSFWQIKNSAGFFFPRNVFFLTWPVKYLESNYGIFLIDLSDVFFSYKMPICWRTNKYIRLIVCTIRLQRFKNVKSCEQLNLLINYILSLNFKVY